MDEESAGEILPFSFSARRRGLCSGAPGGVFELYLVLRRPPGEDGLLGDEAVAAALRVLVDPVHLALVDAALLVVMVRDVTGIGSAVAEE